MLSRLSFGVEGTAHLCAAEGAVVEQAAVVAGERHALGHTLVDDGAADFCQTVHIGLTSTVVTSLDSVAEEAFHTVAVILIVLGRIDAALSCDAVGAARRVLDAEDVDIKAHGTKRGGCRSASQSSAYHDNVEFALVGQVDQLLRGFIVGPFLSERTSGYFRVKFHIIV